MSIDASLKRIEKTTGVGERCLKCRVHYIRFGDEIRRTPAADLFVTTCATCKQTLKFILSGYTEREREVLKALSSDRELHNDASRYLATYAWTRHLPRFQEIIRIGEAEEKRLRSLARDLKARKAVLTLDEYAAEKAALQASFERKDAKEKLTKKEDWQVVIA